MLPIFVRRAVYALFLTARSLAAPGVFGVSALILDGRGHVLLVRHGYRPGWHLPGGGVDRGEAIETAIRREMAEEVGLSGGAASLVGFFAARMLWMGHVVALYRIEGAHIDFRPGWEIREMMWVDPKAPPPGTAGSTLRRLAELGGAPVSQLW